MLDYLHSQTSRIGLLRQSAALPSLSTTVTQVSKQFPLETLFKAGWLLYVPPASTVKITLFYHALYIWV